MRFDSPTPAQVPLLKQLWQTAFGDTEEFLQDFFSTAFSPLRCRIAQVKERTAGMLYWFDVTCRDQKMAYLYAVATHPDHRGQSICRRLMADTRELLKSQGYAGAILVPQTEELRAMYAAFGYRHCTTVSETFCACADAPVDIHQIDALEYARLRRLSLPENSVIQEGESLRFLDTQVQFYRGTDFLLAGQVLEEDTFFGAELLGSVSACPGILRALGCSQGTFRTPGEKLPFAMFLPFTEDAVVPEYFGFPFD